MRDYTNLFAPNDYEKNNKIILKHFQWLKRLRWKALYCVTCGKYRKFEKPKISYILEKTLVLSIICSKCKSEDDKIFKKKNKNNCDIRNSWFNRKCINV